MNRLVKNWPNRIKYVDDSTIYKVIPRCLPSCLPCIANEISNFASERRMRLNPTKCRELIVNFLQFQPSPVNGPQLMSSVIKRVSSYKMLDVYVSPDLSWGKHIEYVYNMANKRLHALRFLKRAGVSVNDLVRIYCALIRSVLEYTSPVWSSLPDYLSNHIESIQKRALRIILGVN